LVFFVMAPLAILASAPAWKDPRPSYSFSEYMNDFAKDYNNTELDLRRSIFEDSRDAAIAHNANLTHTWKQSLNQFSDRTAAEFRNSHGFLPSWASQQGLRVERSPHVPADFQLGDLPKSVDWRTKGIVTKIKNQGMCGSCYAFSSTESIESYVALNSSVLLELSPQQLVSCSKNPHNCGGKGGCRGSIPELAFDYVKAHGLASESKYPYVSGGTSQNGECKDASIKPNATITGWARLPANNYSAVMWALAHVGPLSINIDAIPMQSYGGGLFQGCALDKTHIDHVVQLVGYGHDEDFDKDYWIVRNSWGTTWGDQGYIQIERHEPKDDWCSIDIYPSDGTGCDGGPGTVTTCGSCGLLYDVSYPLGAHLLH